MNQTVRPLPQPVRIGHSACPHDCPSTCALEVEVLDDRTIGRVRGAPDGNGRAGHRTTTAVPIQYGEIRLNCQP